MITLILGSIGSGKSYEGVVFYVLPAIKQGRKIITNLPLQIDKLEFIYPGCSKLIELREPVKGSLFPFQSPSDYGDEWRHPVNGTGPLYIIDEAHEPLPRVRKKNVDREAVELWFARSRHETADVVLISQTHRKVNANIVDLAQMVIRVRKNTAMGSTKSYRRLVFDGLGGEKIGGVKIRRYKKEYFPLYQSYTSGGGIEEVNTGVKVRPLYFHPIFISLFLVFAYVFYKLVFGGVSVDMISPSTKSESVVGIPQATDLRARFKPVNTVLAASDTGPMADTGPITAPVDIIPAAPLSKYRINLVGWYQFDGSKKFVFGIWDGNLQRHQYNQSELVNLGYSFEPIDDCSGFLSFHDRKELIMCGLPLSKSVSQSSIGIGNLANSFRLR